jgi:hypothetical protein
MPHRKIENEKDRADFTRFLGNLQMPFTVEWSVGRDRSLDQNKLQWMWATEAGHQVGLTAAEQQAQWKLVHGVPILREDSATFRETYDRHLKHLPHEEKVRIIRDLDLPITSAMNVGQMVRFLDAIEAECRRNGIEITQPDDDLATYMARYRRPQGRAA